MSKAILGTVLPLLTWIFEDYFQKAIGFRKKYDPIVFYPDAGRAKELKICYIDKNYKKISSIAHNMKSTLSYMGLKQLIPLLQQIEQEWEKENGVARIHDNLILIVQHASLPSGSQGSNLLMLDFY